MTYKEFINNQREIYIGKTVTYDGCEYKIIDVDYNGALLINKKAQFTDTTAIEKWMCKIH